ncbi:RTA1-domain-containing protein [Penicillium malachiteum]|uniref:RTA1-domain-containing protein n=1 Tax=Penicillium malachiteum TaxID=1324776 RepID=UPI002548897C|nr:RTA1-domain-containing protein [Penicillium malachiteum]KAJ5713851.1 RTA1-domain-containing protein [Penicillium malachiteum]
MAVDFVLYYYTPSAAAAAIFIVLFGLSSLLHFWQLIRTRTWFMIPFLIGGILETIGYVGRILSSFQAPNFSTGAYTIQSALILIAPAFLAASIYMTLGRIIEMLDGERCSMIKLKWLTKIFVFGDVLSFLMQASGAGLMVASSNSPSTGEHVIIGGLFVQIIFFGFFTLSAVIFQKRINRYPTGRSTELRSVWHRHLFALYSASILILIRSVVRVVEYIQGYDGFLMKHEVFIYMFDAFMMFLVMAFLQYIHPSEINCFLGRGEYYSEKVIKTQKFAPRNVPETRQERV